jgi:hypothetical protein
MLTRRELKGNNYNHRLHRRQTGAALLAFLLVIIAGSSYMLVRNLNDYSSISQNTETYIALQLAKKALLSYAMNYPELRNSTKKRTWVSSMSGQTRVYRSLIWQSFLELRSFNWQHSWSPAL